MSSVPVVFLVGVFVAAQASKSTFFSPLPATTPETLLPPYMSNAVASFSGTSAGALPPAALSSGQPYLDGSGLLVLQPESLLFQRGLRLQGASPNVPSLPASLGLSPPVAAQLAAAQLAAAQPAAAQQVSTDVNIELQHLLQLNAEHEKMEADLRAEQAKVANDRAKLQEEKSSAARERDVLKVEQAKVKEEKDHRREIAHAENAQVEAKMQQKLQEYESKLQAKEKRAKELYEAQVKQVNEERAKMANEQQQLKQRARQMTLLESHRAKKDGNRIQHTLQVAKSRVEEATKYVQMAAKERRSAIAEVESIRAQALDEVNRIRTEARNRVAEAEAIARHAEQQAAIMKDRMGEEITKTQETLESQANLAQDRVQQAERLMEEMRARALESEQSKNANPASK